MDVQVLYSTWPDEASALACAGALVAEKLAACATVLPGAKSVFRWEGRIEAAQEAVLLAKTAADRAKATKQRILDFHPYDLPCVLAGTADPGASNPDFIEWVWKETR